MQTQMIMQRVKKLLRLWFRDGKLVVEFSDAKSYTDNIPPNSKNVKLLNAKLKQGFIKVKVEFS